MDDSFFDWVGWAGEQIGTTFGELEALAFVSGSGVKQPRGLLSYTLSTDPDSTRAWTEVRYFPTGIAGGFAAAPDGPDVLVNALQSVKAGYRKNCRWLMNSTVAGAVRLLKDSQGRNIWVDGLQADQPSVLLGKPVEVVEDLPDIAVNSSSILIGDWSRAYQIVERPGVKMLADNLTTKGRTKLFTTRRVGGEVRDFNAYRVIRFSVA